jgi:elongation factor 1-beta
MGKEFIALIDVVPEDIDTDFEELIKKLKDTLPNHAVIERYDVIPVAFGLKKARLRVRYPEEWFSKADGIQGIEGIAFSKA